MTHAALKIISIVDETPDTKSFLLQPTDEPVNYRPGQFLTLLHPHSPAIRRSYSLSSHPQLDPWLRITVKRIANGEYSRWLFDNAREGDTLATIGASGFFTFPEAMRSDTTLLFLAAGSGITPVLSLIREALFFRQQPVIVLHSNRSEADTIFLKELRELQNQFPDRLQVHFYFSNHKNLMRARLNKMLLAEFIEQNIADKQNTLAFLCGPLDYMQMVIIALHNESIPVENIRTEIFNTPAPRRKELPPDTDEHQATVNYNNNHYTFAVKYPNTILQTAKLQGIELPYSCEAGRCGTCAATCVSGKVWMSRNEVLSDKEIARGRVLICTSYPIGGDVEVTI